MSSNTTNTPCTSRLSPRCILQRTARLHSTAKRLLALAALAIAGTAAAETVSVADCERDSAIDVWAASDVKFCCDVMSEVFTLAGLQTVRAPFDADGMLVVSNSDVICSAFRTPKLLKDYDFSIQPLGRMHFGLYTTPDRADLMLSMKITDWPRMKVAYSPVSQGSDTDRQNYFQYAGLHPEYVEYRTSEGAVEALRSGEADVLFLYTPYGKRPPGLEEIVPIGMRNIYFAVRKDKPELMKRLRTAYRRWYIDNIDKYDTWREELLGIKRPKKRIRIGAYTRGDLFKVSEDGKRSGLIEEWIRSLCAVTHWTPDYVFGDYDESLADVKSGRLDLIGGLGFTAKRGQDLMFPHTPIGMLRIYLWAHKDSTYEAGHPESWRGMRMGLLSGTLSSERVKHHLEEHHYDITAVEFDSDAALRKAYFEGEVDACVNVEMEELAEEKALRLYASHPMYIVLSKKKQELFEELEYALDTICDDFPKYLRMISERHYGLHSDLAELTIKETEWLANRLKDPTPIVIDFSPWPFEIKDDTGQLHGLPKMLLSELHRRTGLNFDVTAQTGIQTSEAKFLRGDTQFWIPYPDRADVAAAGAAGAVSVFSMTVPQSCASLYGAKDFRAEFEILTNHGTPNELVSILRKVLSGIDTAQFQEMFMAAAAQRIADRYFFGLTDEELREYGLMIALIILVIALSYIVVSLVMLKRHAARAEVAAAMATESAQAKTRFLAMMSHELRTPLNAVIGFAEFLARQGLDEPRRHEYIQGILTSASALLELINDILDLSKLEAGAMNMRSGVCNVEKVMSELPAIFGYRVSNHGVELLVRRTHENEVPSLKLSQQGLRQILINLVGNSAKFTDDGQIIVEYSWMPSSRSLHIEIADTGRGISEEKMSRLFDPFVQDIGTRMHESAGESKGSGLGLPIVKRLVDNAKGVIRVESEIGKGTRFVIDIPSLDVVGGIVASTDRVISGEIVPPNREKAKPMPSKVLVVDDMTMNRKILGIHLKNLGIADVHFAENGLKALEEMEIWLPDIVLSDMWMPEMNGQQLAEAMQKDARTKDIPIVAVTADVDVDSTYNMNLFAKVIAKPVTSEKLKKLFEDL